MKVIAKFLVDKEGNPCVISKCIIDIDETKGKFGMGFGVMRDRETGNLTFYAFKDNPRNPIAVLPEKQKAVEWIELALRKNGYKWYHLYTTGVQKIDGLYAFMVPFDAEGWNELPNDVRELFEKMLALLQS